MGIFIPELTVDLALSTGQQVFDPILTNWGNLGAAADTTSVLYPASTNAPLPSIYAAAVGPLSTVDRFNILYNPQIQGNFSEGGTQNYRRAVSLGDPLTYPTAAGTVPGGTNTTIRVTSALTTIVNVDRRFGFGDTYVKTDGTVAPFGTALSGLIWVSPTLQVLLYLQPPTLSPPVRRPPIYLDRSNAAIADAAEHLHTVVTIAGRRKIRVNWISTGTLTATGRVSVLTSGVTLTDPPQEITAGTVAGITPTTSQGIEITEPCADFLLVYYTQTAGAGNMIAQIYAID